MKVLELEVVSHQILLRDSMTLRLAARRAKTDGSTPPSAHHG
jgi:hypothetical protein